MHFGRRIPMWFIVEYPKSGGSWLARMVAQCMGLPFCEFSVLPLALRCVSFAHWADHRGMSRCIYISRDGRDVLVSQYFHLLRSMWRFPDQRSKKRWRRVFAEPIDPNADHETHSRAFNVFVRVQLGEHAAEHSPDRVRALVPVADAVALHHGQHEDLPVAVLAGDAAFEDRVHSSLYE